MPTFSGFFTMPTVLLNTVLSLFPDRSLTVRGPDTLAVVSPMYNEERGAAGAVRSLLRQSVAPDQVVFSVNGGEDCTYQAVAAELEQHGYHRGSRRTVAGLAATLETWQTEPDGLDITVALFADKTAKSDSINALVASGVVTTDRVLMMDGDTVLAPDFIAVVRDNFYRLERRDGRLQLEDYALQSGAVMSYAPAGSGLLQRLISLGRMAEYAFSGVLRRGQAGIFGSSRVFGRSRLFTVVGCGFVARRDLFPMPSDTMTEDHDFTLEAQGRPPQVIRASGEQLDAAGFRVVVGGREQPLRSMLGMARRVELRRGGNSRFVGKALMLTEDPPHLNGFFRQVERWNGGALENALKRLLMRSRRRAMGANVHFAVWSSQVEDVLGLLLFAALPIAIALNLGNPALGMPLRAMIVWVGLDLVFTALMTAYGFWLYHRAAGVVRLGAAWRSVVDSCRTLLPFLLIKYLNPPAYIASALRVLRHRLRRGPPQTDAGGVTWERPAAIRRAGTPQVVRWGGLVAIVTIVSVAQVAPRLDPINREAWKYLNRSELVDMERFEAVPLAVGFAPAGGTDLEALSTYCAPQFLSQPSPTPRLLTAPAADYQPLSRWGLLTLARLAPIAPLLEEAATAYDLPINLFLTVLLNESYLDPLAVGPTGDKGLSQMTSDALTMLRALSNDPTSRLYNPRLIPERFQVFDPDFSLCAGAAKLSWARAQPGGDRWGGAYALYINPVRGLVDGEVSARHTAAVEAMLGLQVTTELLAAVYEVGRTDLELLSPPERTLVGISEGVRRGEIGLAEAYQRSFALVSELGLDDEAMYLAVLDELFVAPAQGERVTASRR